jgi:HK97 family phage major capsid protein
MEKVNDISTKLNNRVEMLDKEQKRIGDLLTSQTGQMPAEFKDGMSRMNNDLDVLMREFNNLQLYLSKPGAKHFAMGYDSPTIKNEVKTAFIEAIKAVAKGDDYLNGLDPKFQKHTVLKHLSAQRKAIYQNDATTGGFYAMPEFIDDLIKDIVLLSPYRTLATVYQTSNAWIEIPKRTGVSSAYWAVEQATFTKSTDPRLGMVKIYPHEMRGLLQVSLQSLEDSVFDLAGFVQSELAEQFAFLEGNTFVTGDGNEKPEGVMTNTLVGSQNSGSATTFTGDALLKLMHGLKSVYRANSTWILTTGTLGVIRLLKDSQNRPLWQPFASGGLPATIYDRPYVEMPAMDDISASYAYTSGQYPIAIGDFKRAYVIADRVQMSMTRLSELYAESGLVGFIARKRVGGQVVLPQAILKLQIHT